jgi:hypothetical protein
MPSIVEQDSDSKTHRDDADHEESATHLVCPCQVDAIPRLALCSADCSDGDERMAEEVCVVCWHMSHVARVIGCERCRDPKWRGLF